MHFVFLSLLFQCNAKPLALGNTPNTRLLRCRYQHVGIQKSLRTQCDPPKRANNAQHNPQREPMEYSSCWVRKGWVCIGYVDFMFFVSISFVLVSQRKCNFQWSMGFTYSLLTSVTSNNPCGEFFVLDSFQGQSVAFPAVENQSPANEINTLNQCAHFVKVCK